MSLLKRLCVPCIITVLERRIGRYQRARSLLAGPMTSSMTFASELIYTSGVSSPEVMRLASNTDDWRVTSSVYPVAAVKAGPIWRLITCSMVPARATRNTPPSCAWEPPVTAGQPVIITHTDNNRRRLIRSSLQDRPCQERRLCAEATMAIASASTDNQSNPRNQEKPENNFAEARFVKSS